MKQKSMNQMNVDPEGWKHVDITKRPTEMQDLNSSLCWLSYPVSAPDPLEFLL